MANKKQEPIAVVATSVLFAQAQSPHQFWNNIISGKSFIKEVPPHYWLKEDYYHEKPRMPDKTYQTKGSFLDKIPFDTMKYGILPNHVESTDPTQLLAILAADRLLEDTRSFKANRIPREKIGVTLGAASLLNRTSEFGFRVPKPLWEKVLSHHGLNKDQVRVISQDMSAQYLKWSEMTFPGCLANVVAGKICHKLNLKGGNFTVDAACGSSLAAFQVALSQLRSGEIDLALSGGADISNGILGFMLFAQTTALSKSGHCLPFDAKADGTLLGEGLAFFALRRLRDAEKDGDQIYGLIHNVGSSSDGKGSSIYSPVAEGQAQAIKNTYQKTPYSIEDTQLIEAHGTGTPAGDGTEIRGLQLSFGKSKKINSCALGSIKSQIGHTKAAAGAASLFKVLMALHHRVLPGTIGVKKLNPAFKEDSSIYVNTRNRPWIKNKGESRKAAISSFGFGGTNFHMTVEEYVGKRAVRPKKYSNINRGGVFLWGASSVQDLIKQVSCHRKRMSLLGLAGAAKKNQLSFNETSPYRCGVYIENTNDLDLKIDQLLSVIKKGQISLKNDIYFNTETPHPKLAFLFPGQGSQYLNMTRDLLMEFDEARCPWDEFGDLECEGQPLHQVNFPNPAFSQAELKEQVACLNSTQFTQPLLGLSSLSYLRLFEKIKLKADFYAGHSYGELVALYASGVLQSPKDLLFLSLKRGEMMKKATSSQPSGMTVVIAAQEPVEKALGGALHGVTFANFNAPEQVVLSGPIEGLCDIEKNLEKAGLFYQRLPVSAAFHSPLMEACLDDFKVALDRVEWAPWKKPVYSNSTGWQYPREIADIKKTLRDQITKSVRFSKQIVQMDKDGVQVFVEVGPGNVLSSLVGQILPQSNRVNFSDKRKNDLVSFWQALGKLSVLGVKIDFPSLWQEFEDPEEEEIERESSKSVVFLDGSSYSLGQDSKSKNMALAGEPRAMDLIKTEVGIEKNSETLNPIQEEPMYGKQEGQGMSDEKGVKKSDNGDWYKALSQIQENMLNAQKVFQASLLQSHTSFMEVTNNAISQLSGNPGRNDFGLSTKEVENSEVKTHLNGQSPGNTNSSSPSLENHFGSESLSMGPVQTMPSPPMAPASMGFQSANPDLSPSPVDEIKIDMPGGGNTQNEVIQKTPPTKGEVVSSGQFEEVLLNIVADKTGYPKEMLELDADLTSDLGIDSIKSVEIVSDLQDQFPQLKSIGTSQLAELNTLRKIIDFSEDLIHGRNLKITSSEENIKKNSN